METITEWLDRKKKLREYIRTFVPENYEVDIEDSGMAVIIFIPFQEHGLENGTFIQFHSWDEDMKHEFLKQDYARFICKLQGEH